MSDETGPPRRPPSPASRPEAPQEPGPREAWSAFPPNAPVEAPGRAPDPGPNGQEGTESHPRPFEGTSPGDQRHRGGTREGARAGAYREAQPSAAGTPPTRIGLWGSPGSGKTTYLASLPQALSGTDSAIGRWNIYPKSPASAELLKQWNHRLTMERMFPELTLPGNVTNLAWRFAGDLTGSRYLPRRAFRRLPVASEFDLDLIDVSGEIFGHDAKVSPEIVDTALDHLTRAEGLIFLFDPITERDRQTAFEYMSSTLIELSLRIESQGRRIGQFLPHYISVCITKFDDREVFMHAREAGLVNYGPDGMPRVLAGDAETLFDAMCRGKFWKDQRTDSHGGALSVNKKLREYFHPGRIRYYATSSIGYKKPPGWDPQATTRPGFQFDPDNFSNVVETDGVQRIVGPIEPFNVLEPLVELQMQITGRA
jgi:hypothetical protein